jgi:hypothetical protein
VSDETGGPIERLRQFAEDAERLHARAEAEARERPASNEAALWEATRRLAARIAEANEEKIRAAVERAPERVRPLAARLLPQRWANELTASAAQRAEARARLKRATRQGVEDDIEPGELGGGKFSVHAAPAADQHAVTQAEQIAADAEAWPIPGPRRGARRDPRVARALWRAHERGATYARVAVVVGWPEQTVRDWVGWHEDRAAARRDPNVTRVWRAYRGQWEGGDGGADSWTIRMMQAAGLL